VKGVPWAERALETPGSGSVPGVLFRFLRALEMALTFFFPCCELSVGNSAHVLLKACLIIQILGFPFRDSVLFEFSTPCQFRCDTSIGFRSATHFANFIAGYEVRTRAVRPFYPYSSMTIQVGSRSLVMGGEK
jgi:hypothetical protein